MVSTAGQRYNATTNTKICHEYRRRPLARHVHVSVMRRVLRLAKALRFWVRLHRYSQKLAGYFYAFLVLAQS